MTLTIGLGGAGGSMGQTIQNLVDTDDRYDDVDIGVAFDPTSGDYATVDDYTGDLSEEIDVYVDFTRADTVLDNVQAAGDNGVGSVVGTTGWDDRFEDAAAYAEEHDVHVLYGANFSPHANRLFAQTRETAQSLDDNWDAEVIERHHTSKEDAPSGTALTLYNILNEELWTDDPAAADKVGSTRVGDVAGEHTVIFRQDDGDGQYQLQHVSSGKDEFAHGAIEAAQWLADQDGLSPGLYRYHEDVYLEDVLNR